jgi:hypothetical protein
VSEAATSTDGPMPVMLTSNAGPAVTTGFIVVVGVSANIELVVVMVGLVVVTGVVVVANGVAVVTGLIVAAGLAENKSLVGFAVVPDVVVIAGFVVVAGVVVVTEGAANIGSSAKADVVMSSADNNTKE